MFISANTNLGFAVIQYSLITPSFLKVCIVYYSPCLIILLRTGLPPDFINLRHNVALSFLAQCIFSMH